MGGLVSKGVRIENIVLNAGILKYPNVSISDLPTSARQGEKLMRVTESDRNVRD